jgi:hypothetical protein
VLWKKRRRRGASSFDGFTFSKGIAKREAEEDAISAEETARRRRVRDDIVAREKGECRCCREFFKRLRPIESMHEIEPRSIGGAVSTENSIGVCGSGTTGCHGALQANRIRCEKLTPAGANGKLRFSLVEQDSNS